MPVSASDNLELSIQAKPENEKQKAESSIFLKRSDFLAKRSRVTDRLSKEKAIAHKLLPFLDSARKTAAYIPIKDEVDIFDELVDWIQSDPAHPYFSPSPQSAPLTGRKSQISREFLNATDLLVPKVMSKTEMIFLPCKNLKKSSWGILEPDLDPSQCQIPDLLIIPMAGFDQLNRMGYGGGYYDRFLAAHPHAEKIAIAFDEQEGKIKVHDWDVPMDCIITPARILCSSDFKNRHADVLEKLENVRDSLVVFDLDNHPAAAAAAKDSPDHEPVF